MDGEVIIGTKLDTKNFEAQIKEIEYELQQIDYELSHAKELKLDTRTISEYNKKAEQLNNKLISLRQKQDALNRQGFNNIKNSIDKVGNSVENVTKKVGRWALAIFGVRSAYMAVRNAMNIISENDAQLKADIDYIRNALAYTLEPVVRQIIELVKNLLFYIGYIIKAWTGKNIFENANKSLKGANTEAKKLNKTIAGFDEMNVLSDNSSSDSGNVAPSFNLSNFEDVQPPAWLTFIVDHKDEILATLAGIATAIGLIKMGLDPIMSLGIGLAIVGIIYAIEALIDYLKNPSLENFGKIITGIGLAVAGIAIAFGAWPVAIGAAIAAIIGIVVSNWDKIKKTIQGAIDWLKENFANLGGEVLKPLLSILPNAIQIMLDFIDNAINSAKNIFDGLIKFIKGVFTGDWKLAWEGIKQILKGIFDGFINIMTTPIKAAWTIIEGVFKTGINMINGIWTRIKEGAVAAYNGIKTAFSGLASFFKTIFTNAWNGVKAVFSTGGKVFTGIKDGILNAFKKIVNTLIDGINKVVKIPFDGINKALKAIKNINILGQKPFKGLISTISVPKIPKLAKGTILNNPGKGVPVAGGQAIAGEAGREAYLPLSDTQLLEELGATIGRYININATVPVYVGNRQIAKEIKRINAENDFAFNR